MHYPGECYRLMIVKVTYPFIVKCSVIMQQKGQRRCKKNCILGNGLFIYLFMYLFIANCLNPCCRDIAIYQWKTFSVVCNVYIYSELIQAKG
uniref:Uncharacterized protein n=1 Tax=Anguilla anguilla TaxID=7936 RepID=A0A0E9W821_ANGAN